MLIKALVDYALRSHHRLRCLMNATCFLRLAKWALLGVSQRFSLRLKNWKWQRRARNTLTRQRGGKKFVILRYELSHDWTHGCVYFRREANRHLTLPLIYAYENSVRRSLSSISRNKQQCWDFRPRTADSFPVLLPNYLTEILNYVNECK